MASKLGRYFDNLLIDSVLCYLVMAMCIGVIHIAVNNLLTFVNK
jgi:hypothetical protein